MRKTIPWFILLLTLQGCINLTSTETETPTVVDFTYTDYHSGQAIQGLKVALNKTSYRFYTTNPVDTFVTNNDGRISFAFQNEGGYFYQLVSANNTYGVSSAELTNGERNTRTISLQ